MTTLARASTKKAWAAWAAWAAWEAWAAWAAWAACLIWAPWASVVMARMKMTKTCQTSSQLVSKRLTRSDANEMGFCAASAATHPRTLVELWSTLLAIGRSRIDETHFSTQGTTVDSTTQRYASSASLASVLDLQRTLQPD